MSNEYNEAFEFAVTIAKEAGSLIKEAYYQEKAIHFKDTVDLVTETILVDYFQDKKVEEIVVEKIRKKYPDHLFVGEESVSMGHSEEVITDGPTWIIDPIDGTTNFVSRLPFLCISIGFTVNKEILFGVVYNPILDELYTGQKGKGSHRNGTPLHVSQCETLKNAVVATGFPYDRSEENLDRLLSKIKQVLQACRAIRRFGSAALDICMVAAGQLDIYYEHGVHAWDIAAGCLILTEAGGVVMSLDGSPFDLCKRQVCVTNTILQEEVKLLVK